MCNYPKAPEHKIEEVSENIDRVYEKLTQRHPSSKILLIGDSAGGTLATALTQRLVLQNGKLPSKLILLSPVMDASMSNTQIDKIEPKDPMLSTVGVRSAKKMSAGENLDDPRISPLNGHFNGFPPTLFLMAEHDVTYPDQVLTVEKMKASEMKVEVINGEEMPHIWAFLPVMKEGKEALDKIIEWIKNEE
ncbi:alpha/beta hydrolase fold domain-containing protein [Flammeovirga aprica]|uniref:alpha/beta hydrolase fold domain-containing protein n=1 Tax=Flammeovirga aprica TaxID=29528 RepID=UPI001980D35D|nr:alpha/beta hydrolase [Flammeovirga aprica]